MNSVEKNEKKKNQKTKNKTNKKKPRTIHGTSVALKNPNAPYKLSTYVQLIVTQ